MTPLAPLGDGVILQLTSRMIDPKDQQATIPDFKPDISGDQVAFLRDTLSAVADYAGTAYSRPEPLERLSFIAKTADAVSDLANTWDWNGYENADAAQECLETLSDLALGAPDLLAPVIEQLEAVLERLVAASPDSTHGAFAALLEEPGAAS
jgi:hypothetical protein